MAYQQPYKNLKTPTNTGTGLAEYVLVAEANDFVAGGIKCPAAPIDGDALGLGVSITQAHEFKVGRGFAHIDLAPNMQQLNGTTIGELMFQKLDLKLQVFIPGSYAEVSEQVSNMINKKLIVLIKDSNCTTNTWMQLGCDCTFAYLTVDFSTGTTIDGRKGYMGTFSWQSSFVQYYTHVDGPEELAD